MRAGRRPSAGPLTGAGFLRSQQASQRRIRTFALVRHLPARDPNYRPTRCGICPARQLDGPIFGLGGDQAIHLHLAGRIDELHTASVTDPTRFREPIDLGLERASLKSYIMVLAEP
jgi:hypothetical protein